MTLIDLAGRRFGRLIVIRRNGSRRHYAAWLCRCDCAKVVTVCGWELRFGRTRSCGCLAKEKTLARSFRHGKIKTPEYRVWAGMVARCYTPSATGYEEYYGGIGVRVCDKWRFGVGKKTGFECFVADVGLRPSSVHSIDRYPDPSGDYEPTNVRWATPKQQQENRRDRHV